MDHQSKRLAIEDEKMTVMATKGASYPDPEVLSDPYPFYEAMRNDEAVYREPKSGVFFISRYEDVVFASMHPELFSSRRRKLLASVDPEINAIRDAGFPDSISLTANDPPEHQRFRSLVNKVLTPRRFNALEAGIRDLANNLVDQFVSAGAADLHAQFSKPLPLTVIADMLALDHAAVPELKRWSDDWVAQIGAQSCPLSRPRLVECAQSTTQMQLYFSQVIKERRASPGDDIISLLLATNDAALDPIDHAMLVDMLRIFLVGGNETTTAAISSLMVNLLEYPDNYRRIQENPGLIATAIEEGLRFESPSQWALRTTTADTELSGVTIPEGASVCLLWGSANRDERKFGEEAVRFSLDRPKNSGHIAFGMGVHFCAGAPLARLEMKVALETFLSRLKGLRLAEVDPVKFGDHPILRSVEYLSVKFEPA